MELLIEFFSRQLFGSGLAQTAEEREERQLNGFSIDDVEKEKNRASKLKCVYCKQKGAAIGCCKVQCRRSYHFNCGLNNSCSYEYHKYTSFCKNHVTTSHTERHGDDEFCFICRLGMGGYSAVNSIRHSCCDKWSHVSCLKKLAFDQGDDLSCTSCDSYHEFRANLLASGVFIPGMTTKRTLYS